MEQWGTVTEIDWRMLTLFDLSRARLRIAMKDRAILLALLEVIDGDWVFIKVPPQRGIFRFGKKEKLTPRFVVPFQTDKRVGPMAYKLILPQQLS